MSDEELMALTPEQIEDCARLLLAKDGLSFPSAEPPQAMTVQDKFSSRVEGRVYRVGFYFFQNKEDAEAAANSLNGSLRLESEYISGESWHRFPDDNDYNKNTIVQLNIEIIPVYSRITLIEMREHMKMSDDAQIPLKEWQEQRTAFLERRSVVLNAIWGAECRTKKKNDRDAYMIECLRLADNDQVIARRFFEKRYPTEVVE